MMVALTKAALGVNESSKFCDEQFGFSIERAEGYSGPERTGTPVG